MTSGCAEAEAFFLSIAENKKPKFDKSGSCGIIVLIVEKKCYVANVGDSRAVMSAGCGERLINLSRDHKPDDDREKSRITENKGIVY